MKNSIFAYTILSLLLFSSVVSAQSPMIDLGIFKVGTERNTLEVRLRTAEDVVNGAYSGGIFTVRFPAEYGVTLSAIPNTAQYGYAFAGPVGQFEGYNYYRFQFSGSVNMVNWEKGKEYPMMKIQINGVPPAKTKFELVTQNDWTREHNADYYQELNGLELQRTFYQLPIKFSSFDAVAMPNRSVKLDWEFESDTDLDYSDVEYSIDANTFENLNSVAANEQTDRFDRGYGFIHNTPKSDINYYRIRMVDINGAVLYSPVRAISFDGSNADFQVFPNPSAGPVTLVSRHLDKYPSGIQYELVDNLGKVVSMGNVTDDNVTYDWSKMPSGVYYLKIVNSQEQVAKFQVVLAN